MRNQPPRNNNNSGNNNDRNRFGPRRDDRRNGPGGAGGTGGSRNSGGTGGSRGSYNSGSSGSGQPQRPFRPKRKPYEPPPGQAGVKPPAGATGGGAAGGPRKPAGPMGSRNAGPARGSYNNPSGPLRTDWNEVAEWYDQLVGEGGSEYQAKVVFPGLLRLMTVRPQERMLDVACGQGAFSRVLHQRGARVTGVDASDELIRLAKERSDAGIEFQVADARNLQLPSEHFNAACCVLAIQDIDAINTVFEGVAKSLVVGGRFVIAMMHPCFRPPKSSGWDFDTKLRVQYRRVDRYLLPRKEAIITHPGKDPRGSTWTFHRPLEAYFRALRAAGLFVDALEEWPSHKTSDSGPRAAAENAARREIPMFLALRAVKLNSVTVPAID